MQYLNFTLQKIAISDVSCAKKEHRLTSHNKYKWHWVCNVHYKLDIFLLFLIRKYNPKLIALNSILSSP